MELTFNDFRKRAQNSNLSKWEKIGFPDSYRKETEKLIFDDIVLKLWLNKGSVNRILDIGCGCSNLVTFLIEFSNEFDKNLTLIDSKEMLDNIPKYLYKNHYNIITIAGYFPQIELIPDEKAQGFDAINVYSVIQIAFPEQNIYKFIHKCIDLLKPNGRLLIGDIANVSARERFLKSEDGKNFQDNINTVPEKMRFQIENEERIDDAVVLSILHRFRNFGCETYLMPQAPGLPLANRREDILIIKR
ncbi:class I SAM-dependent methyltransferase [Candidatus Neomarinimicrobiota bacterium]